MRRPLILTIAALAGLLLVWLLVVRAPSPRTGTTPAKPLVQTAPPVQPVVPPPSGASVASKPAEIPGKPAAVTENQPPAPTKPAEPPPDTATTSEDADANAEDGADESDPDTETEDNGPPAIDTDHATDLLADMIAREEASSDGDHLPNAVVQTLKKFDQETADANWSANAEQHIEASLAEWIGALPEEAQAHLALIHVECRETLCQVLAADNDPASQSERSTAGQEWQQAIGSLTKQPWWHALGFVDISTEVGGADDHTLYMSYLLRELKPGAPAEAEPDTGDTGGG
jgi:hypothetical protein